MAKQKDKCKKSPMSAASKHSNRSGRKGMQLNKSNESHMKLAVEEFRKGTVGLRQLARAWGVPK